MDMLTSRYTKKGRYMLNNRELSWLSFNERVMQEAQDKSVPLIQRLRFLGIYSNNQDEFFKVRVANLARLDKDKGKKNKKLSGNFTSNELQRKVSRKALEGQQKFEDTYSNILAEMKSQGIFIINEKMLTEEEKAFCKSYFTDKISPLLVPILIRKSVKLPLLRDESIYHAVKMSSNSRQNSRYAIIEIPQNSQFPRFTVLPGSSTECTRIIFIDDIIRLCLDDIFFMFTYDRIDAYTFKFMRDAELDLDDDISKSLMEKMEEGLTKRSYGRPVRLVYDKEMPEDLLEMLIEKLGLRNSENLTPGGRYHLMRDLMKFPKVNPALEYEKTPPLRHPAFGVNESIFATIKEQDVLLHYPYHTFNHLIDFLREAAMDPQTDSIYMTLYRTAACSRVINALINAARNGKKVTVLLELFARFDEERNMENAEVLRQAGIKVIYGIPGIKVHCKLILVERREGSRLKGYVHVGTGNFNEDTAQIYSDFSLFTTKKEIAEDAERIFEFLEDNYKHLKTQSLLVSPYNMRERFEDLIDNEIKNAKDGRKAYIYVKCNSLTDEDMIMKLYKASKAGVRVRLIIRGACCLMPGEEGFSENIKAISIVDKYLEHARLMIFYNGGKEKVFIGSADWMNRNLSRRVEVCIPILDKEIASNLKDTFSIQWKDRVKARNLNQAQLNQYIGTPPFSKEEFESRSQIALYNYYKSKQEHE